ncbi:hypothetical protein [Spirosoma arcticum]
MNGKPDEPLDQWVRQSLDRLPDAPPPGTTFDAGRLWNQLQPELQNPATHRRGWVGWAAAACLVSVLLGWLWMKQQPESTRRTVASVARLNTPVSIRSEQGATAKTDLSESVPPTNVRRSFRPSARHSERMVKALPTVIPANESAGSIAAVTDSPMIADTKLPVVTQTETAASTAIAPKRRFRVVHLNELQAEEAIRPSPHRTDRFVRLGIGDNGQPVPEAAHPTITWPLTNTNQ